MLKPVPSNRFRLVPPTSPAREKHPRGLPPVGTACATGTPLGKNTLGGYGGVQMALANGVPLVVAGATEEKPEVAAHIAYAGVGINLKKLTPTEQQLKRAIHDVLSNPRYIKRAQELKHEYSMHSGSQKAAELIEQLIQSQHSLS